MNTIAKAMGISALMVLCMLVPCINGIDADVEVEQVYVEDKPITVVGYQTTDEVVKTLNKYSDLVEVSDNISIDNGCYLIDSDAVMHGSIEYGEIEQAVYNGTPVAVVGGGYEVVTAIGKTLGFNATSADMQAYGIRYDPEADVQYVYSVSGFETEAEVALEMYSLMNTVYSADVEILEGVGGAKVYEHTENCGSFGKVNISTAYYAIEDSSDNYNFYMAHYKIQGIANGGHSKSLLGVSSDVSSDPTYGKYQRICDYGPTTESGSSSVSFNAGATVGYDGKPSVTVGFEASWSHSYNDVTSVDGSDLETEHFEVNYDINECTNSGYNTLMVEPGLVVAVGTDGDGAYHAVDNYKAQFCNVVIHGHWHNTFTNFSFPIEVEILQ